MISRGAYLIFLPAGLTVVSSIVFLVSYALYAEVLKENTYLSQTIEVHSFWKKN